MKYFLSAFLLLTCIQKQKGQNSTVIPAERNSLDFYFSTRLLPDQPGCAILALSGDRVVFSGGYGLADLKKKEKVTTKTLFNIGSISKTFVSNGILLLQEQKKLSVEDNIFQYFPAFSKKDIAKKVQIKHLLTHTSGLPDTRFPYRDSIFYLTAGDEENWAPIMKTEKLNFEPGSKFEYSNPAFNALALIIEKVSGKKWQTFVEENIMQPSGMVTSTITDGAHPQSGVAHGYIFSKNQWIEKDYGEEPTFAAAGNGGVWSSVEELALYEKALRNSTFLKEETILESFSVKRFPNWKDKTPEHIGWSWFIGKTPAGYTTIGHTGSQGGFQANYISVPEKKWLIIILSSTPRPLENFTSRIFQFLATGN